MAKKTLEITVWDRDIGKNDFIGKFHVLSILLAKLFICLMHLVVSQMVVLVSLAGEVLSLNHSSAICFPRDHFLPTTDLCKGVFVLSMKNFNTVKGLVIHLV